MLVDQYRESQKERLVPSSIGEPGVEFDYRIKEDHKLHIRIGNAADAKIFAHRQWKGGLHLADRLLNGAINVNDKVVLEVGAGTGLTGLVAGLSARQVLITDYDDEELIGNIRRNVKQNANEKANVKVMAHTWGKEVDDLLVGVYKEGFNVILAADVIWDTFSHESLIDTFVEVLKKEDDARVILVAGYHTGRHVVQAFLRRAQARGLIPDDDAIMEFERGKHKKTYSEVEFDLLDGLNDIDKYREERQKMTIEVKLKCIK
ncbi:hypothetical protein E3Q22_03316 [Wallemia mellicola]|uniref:S-adenosyl-L-methionine-dependent methyltransferase n=2 Tax=Wallemia mellicola TaxID=1708541 RepID=A0A4T0SQ98_9BASI|nr:hypothetical protein WALSEDRAFT_64037 [Wallemia mellicola CBS 633.66]TIB72407.1 hypothetical protein E3Q24_01698 [Wallemia mellicola]EIM21803.1 hypothetical protein WALSEDRAFT_64037 [Wallemia mellicola CBS 633.66]TIB76878.1 hypothetical protein E3Q22_03316 [Wallemia mellicola]TIB83536.1 hypothetical protein E3Q21_02840 [Wallemia mellicola]TIB86373.1 hypothetical protein E3Q20_02832 [Wallemia mellicola]|eukprot:XP_006958107.1 hypothetical protein WALSEDRAFT_64037 [Wallemia mellicola CBS 633.66]